MTSPAIYDDHDAMEKASSINQKYLDALDSGDHGRKKISQMHEDQLANYLRETSVFDQILTPREITAQECEVGVDNDTLYKRIYMQPELRTFLSSFEALPRETQEVFIPRIFLGFYMMSSPRVVLNDYNLLDRLEAAIQAAAGSGGNNIIKGVQAQANIAASGVNTGFRGQIERDDVIALKKAYAGSRARIRKILCTESDYIDFERFKLSDFGDELLGQVFTEGLQSDKIHGVEFVRTIKSDFSRGDLLRDGNIYAFPDENMIGRSYILQGLRFFIERDHQFLYYDAHQARGFIWAVVSRLFKLELYNGGLDLTGAIVDSDELYGNPESVTFKDYYNLADGNYRPNISYV
ncbi:MAG: hypothetical protein ACYS22_21000 [Planctomycetota bacterium]|jgi:hypothetical protein